jgi:hypothetical protein
MVRPGSTDQFGPVWVVTREQENTHLGHFDLKESVGILDTLSKELSNHKDWFSLKFWELHNGILAYTGPIFL